ncbi:hypothetical protein CFOL_v3_18781 [Cephalotus follicularis]|uniref:ERCC4 domain-containing protein n=1 Tax=Cephalotus follicularis TaxID=3775 RepID=A0A1Q3C5G6_CEPFO|nr:hypothetical protein CFOL_v3_18781 [Cephalotus follicularis]
MVLQFHHQILSDLLEDPQGGLLILSSGLSLSSLLCTLVSLHHHQHQGSLLLLTPSPSLKSRILHHLRLPSTEITADLPSNHRHSLYSSRQILFITPRILIVDLLTNRVPSSAISALLLLSAHSLSETSTETFIVRLLKSLNRTVSVFAFSDKPHAMVSGFAKAERTMKSLFIKRLHLWPRFQVNVSEELEREPPVVVDVRVPMTKYMVGIQRAIVEVMDACLKEMRKTNKVDVEDLTVENGLFKSFDEIVRRQLDPIWHTLGKKTKQLVSDLKTLRKLLDYLVRYDAVSYLKYLDTLRVSESFRAVWIFAESSYKIFDLAKRRVYRLARSDGIKLKGQSKSMTGKRRKSRGGDEEEEAGGGGLSTSTDCGLVLEEYLEEAPKWKVLREILEEIEEERQKQASSGEEILVEGGADNNGIVLVACKDERSCMQLEDCIKNSPQKVMREEWEKYLLSKEQLRGLQTPQKKKSKNPKGFGILDGAVLVTSAQNADASSICKQEHDALVAAASEIRNAGKKDIDTGDDPEPNVNKGGCKKAKRKGRNKKAPANARDSGKNDNSSNMGAVEDKREIYGAEDNEGQTDETSPILRKHIEEADATRFGESKRLPPVHFYALESDQPILDVLKPSAIIVYHPDMTFVREIEVYKAENPSKNLKVYFLFYEDSTEGQKFEASIRRENGAFESLIRQKSLMMIPVDQDGHCLGLHSTLDPHASSSQNSITRKAGGRKEVEKEMQVIVDMREFMSSLPNVLHQKGMRIIPVTLEVGDYILSPLICVERKSIQDLFMSFTSGRLFHQVEMMVRYYRMPVLLIEFSQDKSFSFQVNSQSDLNLSQEKAITVESLLC